MLQRTGADVGAGVEFAHQPLEDAGAQVWAAEVGQAATQGRVKAGEGVLSGGGQVTVCAGQLARDGLGEGVEGAQGFVGGLLGADRLAEQLAELVALVPGPAGVDVNRTGIARGRGSGHRALLGDALTIHGFPFNGGHVVDG